jgi:hypothetical protein
VAIVALWGAVAIHAQIAAIPDPLPPIQTRGLRVEIRDVARLPDTRMLRPASEDTSPQSWARVSFVKDIADGRRFANDSRGRLYLLDRNNQPSLYADVQAVFPLGFYRSLQSGFVGFEFHPEFAKNGLFYTVHGEKATGNPATPDFIPPGYTMKDLTYQTVVTEWRATRPSAGVFDGTRRELLRVGHVVNNYFHPIGALEFNPTSRPGRPDYGLLYTSGSDWGFSNGGGPNASNPSQTQRLDSLVGAMLRVDPRSPAASRGTKGVGDYTVPAINKYAADNDPRTLGEIYAHGLRNTHRLSWDPGDGTLFGSDIGMSQVEEINILREGHNYGWMRREGIWDNAVNVPGGNLAQVVALPANVLDGTVKDGFTYPVAMYDHGDGQSIAAGFVYTGRIGPLRGKFVFGDLARGRVFAADVAALKKADDGIPGTVAPIEEIQLFVRGADGRERDVTMQELAAQAMGAAVTRADLHLSRARDGELLLTTRQDGMIRTLVPSTARSRTAARTDIAP